MKSIFLDNKLYEKWNSFAQESHDAWFWHTTDYMEFMVELPTYRFINNYSFFIEENSEVVAICPAIVEESVVNGEKHSRFSYAGQAMPAIAIKNNISQLRVNKIIRFYLEEIHNLAKVNNVGCISIKIPSLAKSFLTKHFPIPNPFIKYGFIDLPYQTQILDLRKDIDLLWQDVRKGHKSDIKKGKDSIKINIWTIDNISRDKFKQYQFLHQKDAGYVTRSQKTFDLMYGWVKNKRAMLTEAVFNDKTVGFALIILYKQGAYYGSSCKDPDYQKLPTSHLIQWETIRHLKANGILFYNIGLQDYCWQWFRPVSEKDIAISNFKRGFGGVPVPLITGEHYFSKQLMENVFRERINNLRSLELD